MRIIISGSINDDGGKVNYWRKRYKYRTMLWHRLLRDHIVPLDYTIVRYGSETGGWHIPSELIEPDWLVYDFGVGDDITFDIALVERHGCTIHAFDPTPESIVYMQGKSLPGFQFHPVGVWDEDATIRFWKPSSNRLISYSALNLRQTSEYVNCEVKSIKSLADELGHEHIDFIEMDIKGAEQRVIPNMITHRFYPTLLCLEYDRPYAVFSRLSIQWFLAGLRLHRFIQEAGYQLINKDGWNATYLLKTHT